MGARARRAVRFLPRLGVLVACAGGACVYDYDAAFLSDGAGGGSAAPSQGGEMNGDASTNGSGPPTSSGSTAGAGNSGTGASSSAIAGSGGAGAGSGTSAGSGGAGAGSGTSAGSGGAGVSTGPATTSNTTATTTTTSTTAATSTGTGGLPPCSGLGDGTVDCGAANLCGYSIVIQEASGELPAGDGGTIQTGVYLMTEYVNYFAPGGDTFEDVLIIDGGTFWETTSFNGETPVGVSGPIYASGVSVTFETTCPFEGGGTYEFTAQGADFDLYDSNGYSYRYTRVGPPP